MLKAIESSCILAHLSYHWISATEDMTTWHTDHVRAPAATYISNINAAFFLKNIKNNQSSKYSSLSPSGSRLNRLNKVEHAAHFGE